MGRHSTYTSRSWALWACMALSWLTACQAYDPELLPSERIDAGADAAANSGNSGVKDAGDAPRDADGRDARGGAHDDDAGDRTVSECIPNPDTDPACPEMCPEVCDNVDNDCDGATDEPEASESCALPHAVARCTDGDCAIADCEHLYGNCDDDAANGCETPLDTESDCGGCGSECGELANALSVRCDQGVCIPTQCRDGFDDCDADGSNGCEAALDTLEHCGGCGVECAGFSCPGGVCSQLVCEEGSADCDGDQDNGCEVSLDSVTDCGRCGNACTAANATMECAQGECAFVECRPGFGDCDGDSANGCETALNTLSDCGECNKVCTVPDGVASCAGGTCTAADCAEGRADCDGDVENGCETSLRTLDNCGVCGQRCEPYENLTVTCETGVCQVAECETGFHDCDQDPLTGCESTLQDLQNCGECERACDYDHAAESCSSGICELIACDSGFGNCNADLADGCETSLTSTSNCGECGNACPSLEHTTMGCTSQQCVIAACEPGWDNCDGDDADGCETSLDSLFNCGACGEGCSLGMACCGDGTCSWLCW